LKIFILGGGYGTRLQPFTTYVPKVLMPVYSKPCVRWIVDSLLAQGFDDLVICVNEWAKEQFIHEFRDTPVKFNVSKEPCGTAGEILMAKRQINDTFLVIYGDDLSFMQYKDLAEFHKARPDATATLALTSKILLEVGIITLDGDLVQKFSEKPMLNEVSHTLLPIVSAWTGVSVLEPEILKYIAVGEDLAKDVFPRVMKDGKRIYGYVVDKEWLDIGNIAHLNHAIDKARRGELGG